MCALCICIRNFAFACVNKHKEERTEHIKYNLGPILLLHIDNNENDIIKNSLSMEHLIVLGMCKLDQVIQPGEPLEIVAGDIIVSGPPDTEDFKYPYPYLVFSESVVYNYVEEDENQSQLQFLRFNESTYSPSKRTLNNIIDVLSQGKFLEMLISR